MARERQGAEPHGPPKDYPCSFCGNLSSPSRLMIGGPPSKDGKHDLFICEECIDVCVRIFSEEGVKRWALPPEQKNNPLNDEQKAIALIDPHRFFLDAYNALFERAITVLLKSHVGGLVAVNDEFGGYQYNKNDIFEFGMRLVIDGRTAELINTILTNIINLETNSEQRILKSMAKEAVLVIQQAAQPDHLALVLNSFVDLDTRTALEKCEEIQKRLTSELQGKIYPKETS